MNKTEVEAILGPPGDYRTALGEIGVLSCRDDAMHWRSDRTRKLDDRTMVWALYMGGKEGAWTGDTFEVSVYLDDSVHVNVLNGYPRRKTQTAFDSLIWRLNRQWLRWFPKPEQAVPKRRTI
jgi:hypothetical protein